MNEPYREHPSEEALERFLLNMSPEEELEILESHVLACGYCVDQLETLETQIAATRLALQKWKKQRILKRSWLKLRVAGNGWFTIPTLSFAATGAVAAAGQFYFRSRVTSPLRRIVHETVVVVRRTSLHMHLNAAGLNPGAIAIELADFKGSIVWKGTSVIRHDPIDVSLPALHMAAPTICASIPAPSWNGGGSPQRIRSRREMDHVV